MADLWNYFGLDWLGMGMSILATYQLGNKKKYGFITFAIANLVWIAIGVFLMKSLGTAVGNFAFLCINVRGYLKWTH